MQSVEELEQDIESLTREITSLCQKRDELKAQKFEKECSELSNHPVVKEFESVFTKFPKLYEVLARENQIVDSNDNDTSDEPSTVDSSFVKRRKLEFSDGSVQNKMFDKSIADLLGDTSSSTSPGKRRSKLQNFKGLESQVSIENAYRLFGITFFPLVDPSDINFQRNDINRKMLGIRLEVFNEGLRQFEKPHYILLKQNLKLNSWSLFKHTIPAFIDLESIFQKIDNGIITTYDQVYLFAKQVYIQLLCVSQRVQIIEELQDIRLISNLEIDLQIAAVSFDIQGMKRVRLFLQDDQVISCDTFDDDELKMLLLGPVKELKLKLGRLLAS
ncbi:hypothetical protein ZYGR_0N04280 [Zygosaccharomyces rouxii]|uniref:ZYRO0D10120p n=2 Tax=Zygosaccharomyces rouxii TaxID=4956 RepID=C5DVX2_ZYGRC|nr:uncharacterized protein ZYRO0D10120g [Zygosaccharomyces rouxii]KAH9200851.1 Cenp-O kinetochore centromere component-domain-containing protein [Zygosaccharomyces rouxii]GAV49023.1 hypothetical protein ZYGR_0N04280 [Zygosaccharomyces rouxii]CAR27941.1 ZYRO0D10120p [Zygosaccharomyces rouxii]